MQIGTHWDTDETAWDVLLACKMTPTGLWTPSLDEARHSARRRQAEREEKRRRVAAEETASRAERQRRAEERERTEALARAAREAKLERERLEQALTIPSRPGPSVYPSPGKRTFAQWERLHPEMLSWEGTQDWSWLAGFDEVAQRAGRWMAYLVDHLYARAALDDLRHPELTDEQFTAVADALFKMGRAVLDLNSEFGRWSRPGYGA